MNFSESNLAVRRQLARLSNTDPEDWFLCLKARFGMAVIFQTIHDLTGHGEIITSPYTCITAVNPILYGKLKPIYADIDQSSLSITTPPAKLISKQTRALVMQHTLGIIGDKTPLRSFCNRHKLLLIEDSAHALTRFARDESGKILADISIHSFGVEKVLTTTKFGGAIYVNPALREQAPEFYKKLTTSLLSLKTPEKGLNFRTKAYRGANALLQRAPRNLKSPLRSFLIHAKILEPAIYPFEQDATQADPVASSVFVNEKILKSLPSLPANLRLRAKNVARYKKHLKPHLYNFVTDSDEPLLAFPIIFENNQKANEAYQLLTTGGFFIRRWYCPLLFPGPKFNRRYHYNPKSAPIAESISPRILCLPTDLDAKSTKRLISLLNPLPSPVSLVEKPVENSTKTVQK